MVHTNSHQPLVKNRALVHVEEEGSRSSPEAVLLCEASR